MARKSPDALAEEFASKYLEAYSARPGLGTLVRHAGGGVRAFRALGALPRYRVHTSSSLDGLDVRRLLKRSLFNRTALRGAMAALVLPEDPADYLKGSSKSKWTLRRRTRAARELGITTRVIEDAAEREVLLRAADAYERSNPRADYRDEAADNTDMLGMTTWLAAFDSSGNAIALAVLPTDGAWSALRYFRTLANTEEATMARYLVMESLVTHLRHRGVRFIGAGVGPHRLPNSLRHFQRIVGFRLIRTRIRSARD